ncbi:hypothetical protein FACS1894105_10760 [Clostridia bacterium]|nr:hypothetical protein FACS1894105_10760 [Clostridia bacterium]
MSRYGQGDEHEFQSQPEHEDAREYDDGVMGGHFHITPDGQLLYHDIEGSEHLTEELDKAAPDIGILSIAMNIGIWKCACGRWNAGKFCPSCGKAENGGAVKVEAAPYIPPNKHPKTRAERKAKNEEWNDSYDPQWRSRRFKRRFSIVVAIIIIIIALLSQKW